MSLRVSVVLPCLEEAKTVGPCVRKARETLERLKIEGEVVVVDNGSRDGSPEIAQAEGARVIRERKRGYGNALIRGMEEARGEILILADADDSYDLTDLERFIRPLENGTDVVVGNRFTGRILPGAMPWKNRVIGNPLLSGLLNHFFRTGIGDAHCGMRSLTKEAFRRIAPRTPGMEFASEMIIKAAKAGLKMAEIPITLHPAGRERPPHLKPFRDGWRHLKFMLLFSPTHLFLIPGLLFLFLGLCLMWLLPFGPLEVGGLYLGAHVGVMGCLLSLLGFKIVILHAFASVYSAAHRFREVDAFVSFLVRRFTPEAGLVAGGLIAAAGLALDGYVLARWIDLRLLEPTAEKFQYVPLAVAGSTLLVLGVEVIFSAFFLSIMEDPVKYGEGPEEGRE